MSQITDVLIFVEDPGAANCVAELPAVLDAQGISTRLLAVGLAKASLHQRGICVENVDGDIAAKAYQIIISIKPQIILVGTAENPDTLGLDLISQARIQGIESVGIIDAYGNAELRFRGRSDYPLTHAPDWLIVPTEPVKDAYVYHGFPTDHVVVCGHPHYDYVRKTAFRLALEDRKVLKRRLFPEAPDDRKVLVFVSEGPARLKPRSQKYLNECTLPYEGKPAGRTEIVVEAFLEAVKPVHPRPYLVFRQHPKDTAEDYADYRSEFDLFNTGGSSLELIYAADFIVGMTGTVMMEAGLLGIPSLAIVPRKDELKLLPTIGMGITPYATKEEQLRSLIPLFLQNKIRISKLDLQEVFVHGALQRMAAFIKKRLQLV